MKRLSAAAINLIFKVALPCLLFKNVGESGFQEAFNPKIMLFSVVSICALCFFLMWIVPKFEKDLKKCGRSGTGDVPLQFYPFGASTGHQHFR